VHPVKVFQQHIAISLSTLVFAHIIAPATYRAGQATRHVGFVADLRNGVEVCPDCKDDAAGTRKTVEMRQCFVWEGEDVQGIILITRPEREFHASLQHCIHVTTGSEKVYPTYRLRLWRSLLNQWFSIALFFSYLVVSF
jgi:hypothetical protein